MLIKKNHAAIKRKHVNPSPVVKMNKISVYTIAFFLLTVTSFVSVHAQFRSAKLQAAGLTCAMCSNAINKSLKTLSFIKRVDADLSQSTFLLEFDESKITDPDAIRKKVEDAGFSISSLVLSGEINNKEYRRGATIDINGIIFCLLDVKEEKLNGKYSFKIVDRGFITEKQQKKYIRMIDAEQCKAPDSSKIYHAMKVD